MPSVCKGVTDIVDVVYRAGVSKKVVRLAPMGVIKG
jgi:RNA-splicing ligase RtcB